MNCKKGHTMKKNHLKISVLMAMMCLGIQSHADINPIDPPGLKAWFSSNQGLIVDGDKVTYWTDKTMSYTAVSTSNLEPTKISGPTIYPALDFNSSEMKVPSLSTAWSTEFTFFFVVSIDALNNGFLMDTKNATSSNRGVFLRPGTTAGGSVQMRVYDGANPNAMENTLSFSSSDLGQYVVLMARMTDEGVSTMRIGDNVNTVNHGISITNISGVSEFTLGAASVGGHNFDGAITAMLIYDKALSDADANGVYSYLEKTYLIPEPSAVALSAGAAMLLITLMIRRRRIS